MYQVLMTLSELRLCYQKTWTSTAQPHHHDPRPLWRAADDSWHADQGDRYSGLIGSGATEREILEDYPYLEDEDITAALDYSSTQMSHRVLAAE